MPHGVPEIPTREQCASRYHTIPERIGDLNVMADVTTMFGDMETTYETLDADYRAHGSLHEMDVPLIIYNYQAPVGAREEFQAKKDLLACLF